MINISMDSQVLSTLMSCPRLTDLRFNQNLTTPGPKSNSLEAGSLVHVILEHFAKSLIKGDTRAQAIDVGFSYGELYRKFGDTYLSDCNPGCALGIPDEAESSYEIGYKFVLSTMEEYFDFWKSDNFTIISAEEVRGEVIYEDSELRVIWKAKFDRIIDMEHGFISMDHKTMKQRRDTISLNNQFIGQCRLLKARQVMVDKIGFQKTLKPKDKFTRTLVNYSMDRIAEWCNDIVPFYARMYKIYHESGYWPPNFTHCESKYGLCQMKSYCESDRNMREEVAKIEYVKGKIWDISNDN